MKSLISKNNFIYNQYAGLGALSFVNGGVWNNKATNIRQWINIDNMCCSTLS
jgi:hypothetical protein